jgi:hypothetical protein
MIMVNQTIGGVPVELVEDGKFPDPKGIVFGSLTEDIAQRITLPSPNNSTCHPTQPIIIEDGVATVTKK